HLDPSERQGWPRAIAHQPLASYVVVRSDADRAVHVDPVEPRREPWLLAIEVGVRIHLRLVRPGEEGSSRERELRTRLDRGRLDRLVAAFFGGAFVDVTLLVTPPHGPATHA